MFFFFFFFSQFFPLKNINFIRGTLKSSSVALSSQFVSVYMSRNICTPQQVRKAMCEISLFLCLSPSLVSLSVVESWIRVLSAVRGSVSAKEGTDCYSLATVWTHTSCGHVSVRMVCFSVLGLFFVFFVFFSPYFFPVIIPFWCFTQRR